VAEGTDPTFYRSPAAAIAGPPEKLAYVAALDPAGGQRDAMTVVDCDAESPTYGEVVGWTDLPTAGNELHHFGWNACSSALCHKGHAHHGVGAWMARLDANTETGGMTIDSRFFPHGDDFPGLRVHQTRLQGGDASSDSYCFVE
jgi:methanethiol oxidase